jgi:hypothetical protein
MSDNNRTSRDLNIQLIQEALKTKTEIILIPRRSHTIKGIPVRYDTDTYRIYVDTGRNIETILLGEIGHTSFPRELYRAIQKKEPIQDKPETPEFNEESETPFMDAVKSGKLKPRDDVPDS